MLSNDATIQNIKQEILYEVAKLAYAGRFEEEKDELAYKMFPGPKARFRCCVYKEREIARQRIRLAEGKCPTESDHPGANNIIQVIEAACADCPLSHYILTDNCRKCMMKACQQACKFGAVSMTRDRAYIDPDKCKECGMCAKACPYNAIADLIRPCKKICPANAITMDENGICEIDENKCIQCGQCIHACPFGAIGSKTDIVVDICSASSGYCFLIRLTNAGQHEVVSFFPSLAASSHSSASACAVRSPPRPTSYISLKPSFLHAVRMLLIVIVSPNCPSTAGATMATTFFPSTIAFITSTISVLEPIAPNGQAWIHCPHWIHLLI